MTRTRLWPQSWGVKVTSGLGEGLREGQSGSYCALTASEKNEEDDEVLNRNRLEGFTAGASLRNKEASLKFFVEHTKYGGEGEDLVKSIPLSF